MRQAGLLDKLNRIRKGAADTYGEGREDQRIAFKRGREMGDKAIEPTRLQSTLGTNRSLTAARELFGMSDENHLKAMRSMGMNLSNDGYTRAGQLLGIIGADLTQDTSRAIWWLLNAPQAVANIANESAIHMANPKLVNSLENVYVPGSGERLRFQTKQGTPEFDQAVEVGAMDEATALLKKGYQIHEEGGEKYIVKRKYEPGHIDSLAIPAGIAMNTGLGLMTPFGGAEGYKAAVPSEEDPSKTANVIAEAASKYILGRTGNLLPWDEFKKVRPDVSKDEYQRYKAFKFDKEADLNPFDDGKMTLPTGVLKYTNEGIHGPEVQFLGRSLPLSTGILPTATATLGAALGARRKRPIIGGFLGGMAGLAGGHVGGSLIEDERRRRNKAENERDTMAM